MKKQITATLYFSLLILGETFAQSMFQKTIGGTDGDYSYCADLTFDGGYIFCGNSGSFNGGFSDIYLVKTDANGDTLWTRTYGSTNREIAFSVAQTSDSGYIMTGFTGITGAEDIYVIKTNSTGDTLWTKIIGGAAKEEGTSIVQSSDGGFALVGSTTSFGAGFNDIYMVKLNAAGDTLWTRTFGVSGNDYGYDLKQTTDGGFIITGEVGHISFNHNVSLVKTDSAGNISWSKAYGDWSIDLGYSVEQTNDNGFIVSGHTTGSAPGEMYLIKTDSAGNLQWSKTYGGAYPDYAEDVEQTADNGYILSGRTQSFGVTGIDVYLVKTDSSGNLQWSRSFGDTATTTFDDDGTTSVRQTSDGGYIIGGYSSSFGSGNSDIYIIKTDANGNSGCHQSDPPTIENNFPTIESNFPLLTGSGGNIYFYSSIIKSGGTVLALCTSVGINETAGNNAISVSPNPSGGSFSISFEGTIIKGRIEILNILSKEVFTENIFNKPGIEINLDNIPGGIYFVKVFDGKKYYSRKLIIGKD